jgi:Family of unknown function (DUF6629)
LCISASVSFGLCGLLLVNGALCVAGAVRCDRRLLPLAVIPVVFGIQQFCEGWVWVGVNGANAGLVKVSALAYLFFALFFWLMWVPFSTTLIEPRRRVKAGLWVFMAVGAALGGSLYLPILMRPEWLAVDVVGHSIHYNIDASLVERVLSGLVWQLVYVAVVAVPFMASPIRRLFHFGLAAVLSAAVSMVFFPSTAASVWCFFAAVLSLYLSGLFYRMPARVVSPALS